MTGEAMSDAENHLNMSAGRAGRVRQPLPLAAMLVSKRDPKRELLLTVDPAAGELNVKLFSGILEAVGTAPCAIQQPDAHTATVIATVQVREHEAVASKHLGDINLAVTWSVLACGRGVILDVAGTALAFWPDERRPEEFRALRFHPFNRHDAADTTAHHPSGSGRVEPTPGRGIHPKWPRVRLPRYRDRLAPSPAWATAA